MASPSDPPSSHTRGMLNANGEGDDAAASSSGNNNNEEAEKGNKGVPIYDDVGGDAVSEATEADEVGHNNGEQDDGEDIYVKVESLVTTTTSPPRMMNDAMRRTLNIPPDDTPERMERIKNYHYGNSSSSISAAVSATGTGGHDDDDDDTRHSRKEGTTGQQPPSSLSSSAGGGGGNEEEKIGFSFSPGGLLFPYHLGVLAGLTEQGYVTDQTPLAGSSAGAIAVALAASGVHPYDAINSSIRIAEKCELLGGARGRLLPLLEEELDGFLPDDAHVRINQRRGLTGLAYREVFPRPRSVLATSFDTRDELIEAICNSSMFPFFTSNTPFVVRKSRKQQLLQEEEREQQQQQRQQMKDSSSSVVVSSSSPPPRGKIPIVEVGNNKVVGSEAPSLTVNRTGLFDNKEAGDGDGGRDGAGNKNKAEEPSNVSPNDASHHALAASALQVKGNEYSSCVKDDGTTTPVSDQSTIEGAGRPAHPKPSTTQHDEKEDDGYVVLAAADSFSKEEGISNPSNRRPSAAPLRNLFGNIRNGLGKNGLQGPAASASSNADGGATPMSRVGSFLSRRGSGTIGSNNNIDDRNNASASNAVAGGGGGGGGGLFGGLPRIDIDSMPRLVVDGFFTTNRQRFGCPEFPDHLHLDRTVTVSCFPHEAAGLSASEAHDRISPSFGTSSGGGDGRSGVAGAGAGVGAAGAAAGASIMIRLAKKAATPAKPHEQIDMFEAGRADADRWVREEKMRRGGAALQQQRQGTRKGGANVVERDPLQDEPVMAGTNSLLPTGGPGASESTTSGKPASSMTTDEDTVEEAPRIVVSV